MFTNCRWMSYFNKIRMQKAHIKLEFVFVYSMCKNIFLFVQNWCDKAKQNFVRK